MINKFEAFRFIKQRAKTEKEINRSKIKELPKFIMDKFDGSRISECLMNRVQIGRSSKNPNKLIVELIDVRNNINIRIGFKIDKNFSVISPDIFYMTKNGSMVLHSIKNNHSLAHKIDLKQIQNVQDKIMEYFKGGSKN